MESYTKYLVMQESVEYSDEFGNTYPNVFSFPIRNFAYSETPTQYNLTEIDIQRFDLLVYSFYNTSIYDDIVLWLNNINHISDTPIGTTIYLPTKNDIDAFYRKYYQ